MAKNLKEEQAKGSWAIIKTPARLSTKFSNPNLKFATTANTDGVDKSVKIIVSFFACSGEGALDFGKIALDKVQLKKNVMDLESNELVLIL